MNFQQTASSGERRLQKNAVFRENTLTSAREAARNMERRYVTGYGSNKRQTSNKLRLQRNTHWRVSRSCRMVARLRKQMILLSALTLHHVHVSANKRNMERRYVTTYGSYGDTTNGRGVYWQAQQNWRGWTTVCNSTRTRTNEPKNTTTAFTK